jgi:hypothetical protein
VLKLKKILLIFALISLLLAACNNQTPEKKVGENEELQMIDVAIQLDPEKADPGQEVTIKAAVTQGDEKVEDADEVKFEVWKHGEEDHEMVEGKHVGEGIYSIKKTFNEEGTYYVVAHVTARGMHNMPKKEFIIGQPSKTTEEQNQTSEHNHNNEGHKHGYSNATIEFNKQEPFKVNEKKTLSVQVKKESQPVKGAHVSFEIWKEGESKHQYIEAKESKDGQYEAVYTFPTDGNYHVKIHVENQELHEHLEETVQVK